MPKLPLLTTSMVLVRLGLAWGQFSKSGGAGHALQFADHAVVLDGFKGLNTDEFTFEAWISTSDFCHLSAIMSYSFNASSSDAHVQAQKLNSFVIMHPWHIFACHDFEFLDYEPDACFAAYKSEWTANVVESDQAWHHLAVTWTAAANGTMRIFMDGLLTNTIATGKTERLPSGGSFMLGGEQDCAGGCTDRDQAFYGLMDEVRVWRVARTQQQIMANMRLSDLSSQDPLEAADLVAYWHFNDPDQVPGVLQAHLTAKSVGKYKNDLPLVTPPSRHRYYFRQGQHAKAFTALQFHNNYAVNEFARGMPTGDFTVAFWAKTPAFDASKAGLEDDTFFSYATHLPASAAGTGTKESAFVDNGIRISKYYYQYANTSTVSFQDVDTIGTISLDINANRIGSGYSNNNHLSYAAHWVDDGWHHIAATWVQSTGHAELYFDGVAQTPFLTVSAGYRRANTGGTAKSVAQGTTRLGSGSLVLGQDQGCLAGCFSPAYALDGDMAELRIWSTAHSQDQVQKYMWLRKANPAALAAEWSFARLQSGPLGKHEVPEAHGNDVGSFLLWADAPTWEYSTAPLTYRNGSRVEGPQAGVGGHALALSDKQAVILNNFTDWPSTAITVEFWMQSTDRCRWGTPISYATGSTAAADNTFLLYNYNDWGISIMDRDEGLYHYQSSGLPATDGAWHHIAVTWQSSTGEVCLYDNGRKVWSAIRAKGLRMPPGGTLVIGREQDCMGGCFDSFRSTGAVGNIDKANSMGSQDFTGLLDELRIWSSVRTEEQIQQGMVSARRRGGSQSMGLVAFNASQPADPNHSNLVAYWPFDEGQGFRVGDITKKGHDLILTHAPQWQVVRWMAECGDGNLEGPEECDDGNTANGDGCSASCVVEHYWQCTHTSPSICTWDTHTTRQSGRSGSKTLSGGWTAALVIGIVAVVAAAGIFGYAHRSQLAKVKSWMPTIKWQRMLRLRGRHDALAHVHLDPEQKLELAPEFVGATAPPQGAYQPLSGGDSEA